MEGIFTLPYSEFEIINQFSKKMTKSSGYSFYIPTSRQQKGIDFIIHNYKTNKFIRMQVKSSRSFAGDPKELESGNHKYKYNLRFNNFIDRYEDNNADYYLLFGLYPVYNISKNIKSKKSFWKTIILCFTEEEMISFLKKIKTKKTNKKDLFFAFGFNDEKNIYGTRGLLEYEDVSKFLLKNKLDELKDRLK